MKMLKNTALLLAVLALAGLLAGCESDSVAPHDPLPELDEGDAATQTGVVAYALTNIAPYLNERDSTKEVRTNTFNGEHGLTGQVLTDFRDGPDGAPAPAGSAAWARLYTEAPVVWATGLGGETAFSLDIMATLARDPDTATILAGSNGGFVSGDYATSFEMDGIVVHSGGDYPTAGSLTVNSGDHVAVATFNGTNMVTVIVDSMMTYIVNLDTGEATEVMPV